MLVLAENHHFISLVLSFCFNRNSYLCNLHHAYDTNCYQYHLGVFEGQEREGLEAPVDAPDNYQLSFTTQVPVKA